MKDFREKQFSEVPGGYYDNVGFYFTPNGSFFDPDGVYFNREGLDRHGGKYDDNMEYIPGPGWLADYMCYEDEKDNYIEDDDHAEFREDCDELNDLYEDIDYDEILKGDEDYESHHPNRRQDNFQHRNDNYGSGHRGGYNRHPNQNRQQNFNEKKQPVELTGSIYNSIPEEKKLKVVEEQPKKIETVLKAEDLFGNTDILNKMDNKEVKVNYAGFEIQAFGDDEKKK